MNRRLFLASPLAFAVKPSSASVAHAAGFIEKYGFDFGYGKGGPANTIKHEYYGQGKIIWTSDKGFHI